MEKKVLFIASSFIISIVIFGCSIGVKSPQAQFQYQLDGAEKGSSTAQYIVGFMYQRGDGVTRDVKKACEWFEKSASRDPDAMLEMYKCYSEGGGFDRSPDQARKWLLLAAKARPKPNTALTQIATNLGDQYKNADLVAFANNGIATKADLDKTILAMKSDQYFSKNFNNYDAASVQLWIKANDSATANGITLSQSLEAIKKEQDAQIAKQMAKDAETKKQAEQARQLEIQAKAEQDRAAAQAKVKLAEREKNSWYNYKKIGKIYVCDPPFSVDDNPGTMLSTAKHAIDSKAYVENEIKENGQIIGVDIVVPTKNGVIKYIRGKQRCEILIERLNAQIKNEDEALKRKYK